MSEIPPSALLTSDALGPNMLGGPQWGIFDQSGKPLILADSVYDVDYQRDYRISDYPQEQGAFMSYNKVKVSFDAEVGFLTSQTRFQVLNMIEALAASLNLVAVITPETSYPSANIVGYRLRRASREGMTLVLIIVKLKEVRIVALAATLSGQIAGSPAGSGLAQRSDANASAITQSTNAASPTSSGQTQAEIPSQPPIQSGTNFATTLSGGGGAVGFGDPAPIAPINPSLPALPA